jgi:hypothetical protein
MASVEVSINQLPVTNQITDGDFLIIQTPNATNRLDFSDFVVGLENTTFSNTIINNTTDIQALSTDVVTNTTNIEALSTDVVTNTTNIESLSSTLYESAPDANIGQSTHLIPIVIGGVNYAIMLSATS